MDKPPNGQKNIWASAQRKMLIVLIHILALIIDYEVPMNI